MIRHKIRAHRQVLPPDDVAAARQYIANYWSTLTVTNKKLNETLLGLPHPYIVPALQAGNEFEFSEQYYWDSYFIIQGLLGSKKHKKLVIGMLDNLLYMYRQHGIIPNASRTYMLSRSQPPLLTSFIWDVYEAYKLDIDWLKPRMAVAMNEYMTVWTAKKKPHDRNVYKGLSRYYDINMLHDLAETESGWDMTPRFGRKCLDYVPVDLNCYLYVYESHFARYCHLVGRHTDAARWELRARRRKRTINELMWNSAKGLYYDFNYVKNRRASVSSLAGLIPLWAGVAHHDQARKMVKALKKFEHSGGLSATDIQNFNLSMPGATPTQWAYPNGWAPLHFLVTQGLKRYGYDRHARRIAEKWLKTNLSWYVEHGVFIEKYNVVDPNKPPIKGVYSTPSGFGWSNAVFERFCQEYIDPS